MPESSTSSPSPGAGPRRSLVAAVVVMVVAMGGVIYLLQTAPQTAAEPEVNELKVVSAQEVEAKSHRIRIVDYGEVIPARQVTLSSEVGGRVVRQHAGLVPGGYLSEGEEILGIDAADYQIRLEEQRALLAEAESELALEEGRQVVAAREWKQLQQDLPEMEVNEDLVLRKPHRRKLEAAVARARSQIERAELDLERTSLRVPFNAVVLDESVELGQLVHVGDVIATLVGADTFWVRVSVRQEQLMRIRTLGGSQEDGDGAEARITLETGEGEAIYPGKVLRVLSDLEPLGRNARVIVQVEDPLGRRPEGISEDMALPLLLRSFVKVEIDAGQLGHAIALDRAHLREGNQLWVVDAADQLQIRQAEVLWRQDDQVYVADTLEPGDAIVVSNLRALVPGTRVQPERQTP